MISPGVTLGGRYRLDERIGSGGMGDVWRGTDDVLGRTVAVKIMLPALLDEPGFAERFRGEARTMATINHPGVVDIYDYGSDGQVAFLVMEYVEGDPLSRTLSRVSRLTVARTMALVAQAADALQAAHDKGIVHRDVKPGNLLVRPNGTLVLTDFGIARSALVGQLTAAGAVLGTAAYISPEQATGGVVTAASDVYALGVVAYQCLAGRRPYDGNSALEIAMRHVREPARPLPADIPPPVRSIVERAMAKDPAARWPSAASLANAARHAATTFAGPNHGQGPQPPYAVRPGPAASGSPVPTPGSPAAARGSATAARPHAAPAAPHVGSAAPHVGSAAPQTGSAGPGVGSAARGARGAAPVPAGPRPEDRQPRPGTAPAQPVRSSNRSIVMVLVLILGLLILLCAGVISYLASGAPLGAPRAPGNSPVSVVTDGLRVGHDDLAGTPYRRVVRAAAPGAVPTT
jgi:eukaryotic-like serine/threonine-protein kinase